MTKDWPTDSKHYIDIWKREEYENPQLSYEDKCKKQYIRDFGPFESEEAYLKSVGEILEGDIF